MLKIKQELRYRKGSKKAKCSYCTAFVPNFSVSGIGGIDLGEQSRCKVIGLKPGRMYRVGFDNLCDRYTDRFGNTL